MMRVVFFLIALCLVVTLVFAAGAASSKGKTSDAASAVSEVKNAQSSAAAETPVKSKRAKDMTVQELVDGITKVLDQNKELMNYVPGFKQEKDPDGKEYYTHNGIRLEKVEKEKLSALYTRIRQERTRLNTERINRQLETIRQAQQATNLANQAARQVPAVPMPPPQPPRTVEPPRTPPTPPPTPRR